MKFIKKLFPYVLGASIGVAGLYYWPDDAEEKIEQLKEEVVDVLPKPVGDGEISGENNQPGSEVIISESNEPVKVYCPKQETCPPPPECKPTPIPVEKIKWKVKYKDRIVYVPKDLEPGCHVNWETGDVQAKTTGNLNLKCVVDVIQKKVKTYFWESGKLRRKLPESPANLSHP